MFRKLRSQFSLHIIYKILLCLDSAYGKEENNLSSKSTKGRSCSIRSDFRERGVRWVGWLIKACKKW